MKQKDNLSKQAHCLNIGRLIAQCVVRNALISIMIVRCGLLCGLKNRTVLVFGTTTTVGITRLSLDVLNLVVYLCII